MAKTICCKIKFRDKTKLSVQNVDINERQCLEEAPDPNNTQNRATGTTIKAKARDLVQCNHNKT